MGAPPLQYTHDDPFDNKGLEEWVSSFQNPINYENYDLDITAGDDVALPSDAKEGVFR